MSTPEAKRRRLNQATKTLHKPFKSPFRAPMKSLPSSGPPSSDPLDIGISTGSSAYTTPTPREPARRIANEMKPPQPFPSHSTHIRVLPRNPASKPSIAREIMQIRNDIQILTQAHTLATSSKDEDLMVLIDRWRTASRAAAEELFASTRDRVNRMGGVSAWREREREQKEWRMKADMEEMEAERERLCKAKEKGDIDEVPYQDTADVTAEDNNDDEVFSGADDDVSRIYIRAAGDECLLTGYSPSRWI